MKFFLLILGLILSNSFITVYGGGIEKTETLKFLEEENFSGEEEDESYDRNSLIYLGHNFVTLDGTRGYSTLENRFPVSACFVPKSEKAHSSESHLGFKSVMDRNEFFHSLEIRFGFKIGIPIPFTTISVGFGFDFGYGESTQKETNSASYYFVTEYYRKRDFIYYSPSKPEKFLTPSAYKLFLESKNNNDDKFTEICGDKLVEQVTEGGMIVIEVNVDFLSFEHMKKFEFAFSFQITQSGVFSAGLGISIKNAMKKGMIEGRTTIRGWQIGGDPERLGKILYAEKKSKCSQIIVNYQEDPKKKGLEKKMDEECYKELNNIANYIKTDFPTQFGENPKNYYLFDYHLKNNPIFPKPSVTHVDYAKLDKMKQQLVKFFDRNDHYLNRLDSQIDPNSPKIMKIKILSDFLTILKNNKNIIYKPNVLDENDFRFQDCFENLAKCSEENFNKAFALLDSNVFAHIDKYMEKIKYAIEFDIDLKNCCNPKVRKCGEEFSNIIIRNYPLGDGSYDLTIVGGNYFTNPDFAGFELKKGNNYKVYNYDSFTLFLSPLKEFGPRLTVVNCKNSFKKIFNDCNQNEFLNNCFGDVYLRRTWKFVLNPFYIEPK